jgi:magnesium chelatase family protein
MLVAAMNPCPCGYSGDPHHPCTCSSHQIQRYRGRISGPILDRIDCHIEVPAVRYEELHSSLTGEPSSVIRHRVLKARETQLERFSGDSIYSNVQMKQKHLTKYCNPDSSGHKLLEEAIRRLGLSARAYHRILKVARTIADLEQSQGVAPHHLLEAIQYRSLDRRFF